MMSSGRRIGRKRRRGLRSAMGSGRARRTELGEAEFVEQEQCRFVLFLAWLNFRTVRRRVELKGAKGSGRKKMIWGKKWTKLMEAGKWEKATAKWKSLRLMCLQSVGRVVAGLRVCWPLACLFILPPSKTRACLPPPTFLLPSESSCFCQSGTKSSTHGRSANTAECRQSATKSKSAQSRESASNPRRQSTNSA